VPGTGLEKAIVLEVEGRPASALARYYRSNEQFAASAEKHETLANFFDTRGLPQLARWHLEEGIKIREAKP
jgi:hypothetical protein